MSRLSFVKSAYLSFFSKPAHERSLYRLINKHHPKSIVEVGVGKAIRATRMIQLASRFADNEKVCYTGIDLFEAREVVGSGLPLKEAHRVLKAAGARVKLIPGDPLSALSRSANALQGTDLLVVSADQDADSLKQAWFYVPRMLKDDSLVVIEESSAAGASLQVVTSDVIDHLAGSTASVSRAA